MNKVIVLFMLFMSLYSQAEVPRFDIPIPVSPLNGDLVMVPSYNGNDIDMEGFIELSNQTGLYHSWGWTGEYYVTGVTHGSVYDEYSPDFSSDTCISDTCEA